MIPKRSLWTDGPEDGQRGRWVIPQPRLVRVVPGCLPLVLLDFPISSAATHKPALYLGRQ